MGYRVDSPKIGNYTIVTELGRGAMGVVYKALDPAIGRPVAIKVIRIDPGTTAEEGALLRQRLIHEAGAAGNLSHPGIVTVYQLGEEGENVFVAMEYVEGSALETMLTGGARPHPPFALDIIHQIADALDYAHRAGVVHRDIKPANILVRGDGRVKVADFGVAKLTAATNTSSMTIVGQSIGSPSYMSPEQVQAAPVDGRSDQFSLGVVAYRMLAGYLPFAADSTPALLYQIMAAEPKPVQSLPPGASAALARAMAKDPNNRFPNCAAFAQELVRAMGAPHSETTARTMPLPPHLPTQQIPSSGSSNRSVAIPAVVVLLVLLLASGAYWRFRGKPGAPSSSETSTPTATATAPAPLVKAIDEGRLNDAQDLLSKGADINAANPDGTTALMQAAEGSAYLPNNVPALTMLLEKHPNIEAQDARGRTALYLAVAAGKEDAVRLLVEHKADPNKKVGDGSTPVLAAVMYGRVPTLKMLLDNGGDLTIADNQGATALMIASEGTAYLPNNGPLVEILLAKGAQTETQDSRGRTALDRAASEGKLDAVRLLLEKKANPNQKNSTGATPLLDAVTYGKIAVVQFLLEHGADAALADAQANTPLMVAAEGNAYMPNNAPMTTALLATGVKVDEQDTRGRTAFFRAAEEGKEDAMRLLLEKKTNPNLKASDGSTALIQAVANGKMGAVKLLLDSGADVNLVAANGSNPLLIAAEGNSYIKAPAEMISLLLAHKADTKVVDSQGRTPLALATANKNVPAVELLKGK
jgi:ankyrin repeat protein/tRNA A-37 threonylcarbamoyl transferase component Bud32